MQSLLNTVMEFVSRMRAFMSPAGVEQAQPVVAMSPEKMMMIIIRNRQLRAAQRERY